MSIVVDRFTCSANKESCGTSFFFCSNDNFFELTCLIKMPVCLLCLLAMLMFDCHPYVFSCHAWICFPRSACFPCICLLAIIVVFGRYACVCSLWLCLLAMFVFAGYADVFLSCVGLLVTPVYACVCSL